MARFFTADLHLGHRNIARYEPGRALAAGVEPLRGSADDDTQAQLDAFLIDRWNEVVGPDDEVWILGDAVMGQLDRALNLLGRLAGRIVLVPGNHDRVWVGDPRRDRWWDRYLDAGIDEIVDGTAALELADGTLIDVDHFPYVGDHAEADRFVEWRPEDRGRVLLHGHVHSTWRTNGRMINVGVDVWDHTPLAEDRVIDLVRSAGQDLDRQPVLVGDLVRVRPLTDDDLDPLFAVASDPLIWEQHPSKERSERAGFERWFADAMASSGALVLHDLADDTVVGSSRYWGFDPDRREVEIGWTFLARSHWGGPVNADLKRLMVGHAFGSGTVDTIVFRVHSENLRSQRAVQKLGAVLTGTEDDRNGRGQNHVYRLAADDGPE